ncbi:MAG: DUF2892 domain-containing protein [Bacteroidota bacterium]
MKSNMNNTDRIARALSAVIVAILYFTDAINGATALILGALTGVLLFTSLINFCPLYYTIGFSTRKKK